jgi:hypothetical protein
MSKGQSREGGHTAHHIPQLRGHRCLRGDGSLKALDERQALLHLVVAVVGPDRAKLLLELADAGVGLLDRLLALGDSKQSGAADRCVR